MEDFQLPEAIERRPAETIRLEHEERAWQKEVKRFKKRNTLYEQEMESLGTEM